MAIQSYLSYHKLSIYNKTSPYHSFPMNLLTIIHDNIINDIVYNNTLFISIEPHCYNSVLL